MGDHHLQAFRAAKDALFREDHHSPLLPDQREAFAGLEYYPENAALRVEGALEPAEDRGEVNMQTSTGEERVYRRAGVVRFEVDGQEAAITLYAADEDEDFFVPFRDATSGTETYGAGRYLEVERPADGQVVVDFNYAYNPYCAYNERWSCPLPPLENRLEVPIRAGEKSYHGPSHGY